MASGCLFLLGRFGTTLWLILLLFVAVRYGIASAAAVILASILTFCFTVYMITAEEIESIRHASKNDDTERTEHPS